MTGPDSNNEPTVMKPGKRAPGARPTAAPTNLSGSANRDGPRRRSVLEDAFGGRQLSGTRTADAPERAGRVLGQARRGEAAPGSAGSRGIVAVAILIPLLLLLTGLYLVTRGIDRFSQFLPAAERIIFGTKQPREIAPGPPKRASEAPPALKPLLRVPPVQVPSAPAPAVPTRPAEQRL